MPTLPRFLKSPWTWAVTGLVVALYAAVGFLLVPRLVASGLRDYFDSHYHRHVELGAVTFNPFTLEFAIDHFVVPDADGKPLAGLDRLYVDLEFRSLVLLGADVKSITLDRPFARLVRRADGGFNFMDLVPADEPTAPKPDPNAKPPRVWIHEFGVRGGELSFVDQSGRTTTNVALKPITFTLRDFSTRREDNAYRLAARSTLDETFDWQGTFGLEPVESKGQFKIGHLTAHTIAEIGAGALPVELASGSVDVTGSYQVSERDGRHEFTATVAELVCTDVGLRAPGETDSWVQIPRLAVTGTTLDLAAAKVAVEHVVVERPSVKAWRDRGGAINLARLVRSAPPASGAPPAAAAPGGDAPPGAPPQWKVAIPDIKVTGADIQFEDRSLAHVATFRVTPLDVTVGGFAIPAADPLAIGVNARVNGDGQIAVTGSLTLDPLAGRFAVDASDLGLAALQPYLEASTAMTLKSGTAGTKGTLLAGAGGKFQYDGDASVDALRTVDNALEEDFVKWKSVRLVGIHAQSTPLLLKVREVQVHEPYARVIIGSNGQTNLSIVLKPHEPPPVVTPAARSDSGSKLVAVLPPPPAPPAASPARAAAPSAPLPLEIGLVRIADGTMNFSDFSIKPNVETGIQQLSGTIKGVSGRPGARADIDIAGKVDRYAPVTITGQVNFLAALSYTKVKMSFHNVELGVLSPYSGKFAGYRIDKGKLSVDLNYLIEDRKLTADHRIVVNQLQLGEKVDSADATSLPIKLAISLLKDRNGVIELDLPVTGSLDDPQFRLGPIIWKVVINLIEKAVTAPFALLGKLFGGGEEISYLDFPAGSAALDATAHDKLTALVKALDSRPGLNVDLPQVAAPAADAAALADQKWRAEIASRAAHRLGSHAGEPGAADRLLGSPKDYRALLEEAYAAAFSQRAQVPAPPPPAKGAPPPDATALAIGWLEGQLKPRFAAGPDEIDALSQARASAVQSVLLDGTGIDPARVFIIKAGPLPAASGPVRMQLALH